MAGGLAGLTDAQRRQFDRVALMQSRVIGPAGRRWSPVTMAVVRMSVITITRGLVRELGQERAQAAFSAAVARRVAAGRWPAPGEESSLEDVRDKSMRGVADLHRREVPEYRPPP